jgi:anti-anti-sigma factor
MNFKIDTKEKFTVVTPNEPKLYDNMAADLKNTCLPLLKTQVKNVILNLAAVNIIDTEIAQVLFELQQIFYEDNASFVICEVKPAINDIFEKEEVADILNQTPTESEAWDIVQMEEIERELMDGDDMLFEAND